MRPDEPVGADLPLPALLRQLATDTATLVGQEISLARAELTEKSKQFGSCAGLFGAAAAFALGAFGALTAALIAAIGLLLPIWGAALIVAILYGIAAYVGAIRGQAVLKKTGAPALDQTVASIHQDIETVRAGVKRIK